ncbi:MAG TPA: hypothetical protein VK358_19255 [Longimicrobium sp.]|nr:hypothetical protein [Longimicrobium sp.]
MTSARNDAPKAEWEQATEAVFHAVHGQLRSKEKRPVLQSSEAAVWLTWHGAGKPPLQFRIEEPEWWKPLTEAHASDLAARLLAGLREELRLHRERAGA